jgi:AhpD family alkylhydroperoxidase
LNTFVRRKALGVAVSLRCDGCINAHTDAALQAGLSKDEVIDALGVATRTIDAYDTKTRDK